MNEILTVSEITHMIKRELEESFQQVIVEGEISNLKMHVSGHWYFNLKDSESLICCTMWKGFNNYVFFTPQDGMQIIVTGKLSVYPPRGSYQIDVRSMRPRGEGELQAAFEKLKKKLLKEGLFNEDRKRAIPQFPVKIGIATSSEGAALQDMISIADRRYPLAELVIAPCKVQGEGAAASIAASIRQLNTIRDMDVIIIGRGGGSLEDLWAFNEEIVARAVYKSGIPVISAVGHETDFTISDLVADLRAATPSAAMELATPHIQEISAYIREFSLNSARNVLYIVDEKKTQIEHLISSYAFRYPLSLVKTRTQQLDHLTYRIEQEMSLRLVKLKNRIELLDKSVAAHDTQKILKKGFVIVKQDSRCVQSAAEFDAAKNAVLRFRDAEIEVKKL